MNLLEGLPPISLDELRLRRSQELAAAAIKNTFIKLVAYYKNENIDLIQIEVEVELPQYPPIPINTFEQILIWIENENDIPKVFALREDFPKTIHQNLVPEGYPAWLCLYEDPWHEISHFVTPELFVERIREWLHRAAIEELHLSDQPLEPFLVTNQKILISEEILKAGLPDDYILVGILKGYLPQMVPLPLKNLEKFKAENGPNFLGLCVSGQPTFTQIINRLPENLSQLIVLLKKIDIDLENQLQLFIRSLMQHYKISEYGHFKVIVFLHLPKSRSEEKEAETHEYWAFLIDTVIKEIGIAVGVLGSATDVGEGYILAPMSSSQNTHEIERDYGEILVTPYSPVFLFTPTLARKTSGIVNDAFGDMKIGVIGLGALGSTVVMNLARQGVGKWLLVDNDFLLPHNLARHALSGGFVGLPKSLAIQKNLELDYQDVSNAEQFQVNYLSLNGQNEDDSSDCYKKLMSADLILDFAASNAVEMKLSSDSLPAPRLSVYLVPSGKYCIASYEGAGRTTRLDDLNQQLMAYVAQNPELHDLFEFNNNNFQYAGSCRDLSKIIANDYFLGYAGIVSKFIKENLSKLDPKLSLFRWQENPQSLSETPISVTTPVISELNGWKIHSSKTVISLMKEFRDRRLPNETGGVLLGKFDFDEHSIYVSHILSSPPDSKEWPFAYIRGIKGLHQEVKRIASATSNEITYIGEWHSHPTGVSINPSRDDKTALKWVANMQSSVGYPGLLAIIGDNDLPNYLLLSSNLSSD